MHLLFNELSFHPIAENSDQAIQRFRTLLATFKQAKKDYGFTHIRFPENYTTQLITKTLVFNQWIYQVKDRTLRDLILSLCKKPFSDEVSDEELETLADSNIEIVGNAYSKTLTPLGLYLAFLRSTLAASFDSDLRWHARKIALISHASQPETALECITYNICFPADLTSKEIDEWAKNNVACEIDSLESLRRCLNYRRFAIECEDIFVAQLSAWRRDNSVLYKRLLGLMKDVEIHPFTGGIGKTEVLIHAKGVCSKRINREHRLCYTVENEVVIFLRCKGHYEDS